MKVKKKEKEQTNMEKRNTAISMFALATILPLLLTLFVGFRMGQTREVNEDNFQERYSLLEDKKNALEHSIKDLNGTFSRANIYFEKFAKEETPKLEEKLDKAESELAISRWENDMGTSKDVFQHLIDTVGQKSLDKDVLPEINTILDHGKKWLNEFSEVKEDELNSIKRNKKNALGMTVTSDLEREIQELKSELTLKDVEIIQLKAALTQGQGKIEDVIDDVGGDKNKAEAELVALKGKTTGIYDKIIVELDLIRSEIVPSFEGQGFLDFKKNKDKIEALKKELENKLNTIERHASDLK